MDSVILSEYSFVGDNSDVEVRYSIPSLQLSSVETFTQADYNTASSNGGFDGVKLAILKRLQAEITVLIPTTTTTTK